MCNQACLAYGELHLGEGDVRDRRVIEVGARNVNGSLRGYVEGLGPARYVGVDIEAGPGVDEVCNAEDLVSRFGAESFDVVICTEMLEHVRDWRIVVSNLKRLVAPGGTLLVTTRSIGFPYHAFPWDFWRYENDDMRAIFSDLEVENVESDPTAARRVHDRPPPVGARRERPGGVRALLDGPQGPLPRPEPDRGDVVREHLAGPPGRGRSTSRIA